MKILVNNKTNLRNYIILDKYEAGIELYGWEVKSIKNGKISMASSFIKPLGHQLYLTGAKIYSYEFSRSKENDEIRDRKLLLHRNQITKLLQETKQTGYTIVPVMIYSNDNSLIKVEIALAKGAKKYDKRAKLKERDLEKRVNQDRKFFGI